MCRPVVPEPPTTAFEDERHARLRALSRSVGTADGLPGHRSVSVACQLCCQSRRGVARSAPGPHCRVSATSPPDHGERPPYRQMHTTWVATSAARCALLGSGAAVVRQLRRLAIELTDLDRQLDEIEQSER